MEIRGDSDGGGAGPAAPGAMVVLTKDGAAEDEVPRRSEGRHFRDGLT